MAIQRIEINGDMTALKAALETMIPDFFASVELASDESSTTITCKDSNENTIFTIAKTVSGSTTNVAYTAYKNAATSVSCSAAASSANPLYLFKIGESNVVIQCPSSNLVVISKTNTYDTGFVIPNSFASGQTTHLSRLNVACWGDDPSLSSLLTITNASGDTMIGNQCLLVPVPLHGVYGTPIYLPHAFFLPMAQDGMRGTVQQLQDGEVTYLTNGYLAMMDH